MLFPIAIEIPENQGEAYGVIVPDLPGCYSAGDTIDDALRNAREAIELHLEGLSEDGLDIPTPKTVAHHQAHPDFLGRVWGIVDIDVTRYMGKAEKINITLPGSLIRQIDNAVKAMPNESRSGFLAKAALERLAHR